MWVGARQWASLNDYIGCFMEPLDALIIRING